MAAGDAAAAAERVFRTESGRILAGLIRVAGSFDRAEEALQEAFAAALEHWGAELPANPAAWIAAVGRRKLIDRARRERTQRTKQDQLRYESEGLAPPPEIEEVAEAEIGDERLRLIFTCCHPALALEARVALTLRTLGGLTTSEIARAFLLPESTLAQRLVRAKRKIDQARIPYEVPPPERLGERLDSVRAVLYLIFNEGYVAAEGDRLLRRDLCAEAIRLARTLDQLMPGEAETEALLALLLLHDSRRGARANAAGELVPLEEQDRGRWDGEEIGEGLPLVERALRRTRAAGGPPGPYQLQAAIAAVHAEATGADETDWRQIAALYGLLARATPSPVVALNHAVAVAMSAGCEAGLALLERLGAAGELDDYYLYHAARADLLRRLGRRETAAAAYVRALGLTANAVERRYLRRRLAEVAPRP